MFFGIVVLGLLHGLCILPVYLSLLWWRPSVIIRKTALIGKNEASHGEEQETDTAQGLLTDSVEAFVDEWALTRVPDPERETNV